MSTLPGGCGPVSHSCKSKLTTCMVCFHLLFGFELQWVEYNSFFAGYLHTLLCLLGSFFQFDFQRHTVPILLSCFLPCEWVTSCQAHLAVAGNDSPVNGLLVLVLCLFLFKNKEASLKLTCWRWHKGKDIPVQYWFEVESYLQMNHAPDIRNVPPWD